MSSQVAPNPTFRDGRHGGGECDGRHGGAERVELCLVRKRWNVSALACMEKSQEGAESDELGL